MNDRSSRLVLGWVRLYTHGLPAETAERRCAEIESDLWEQGHDPAETAGVALIGRCLRGVPADLWWRYRTLVTATNPRSNDMESSTRWNWWVALTTLIGIAVVVTGVGAGVAGAGDSAWALTGIAGSLVSGGLILGGLYKRSSDLIAGSWLILIGALAGGPFGLPVAAAIVLSGMWSGNMRFGAATQSEPRLVVARRHQHALTRRWYLWLVAGAGLFGFGLLFPLLVFTDDTTDTVTTTPGVIENVLGAAGWMAWWGSWLAAAVSTGIGGILGVAHLFVRRRSHPPAPAVTGS